MNNGNQLKFKVQGEENPNHFSKCFLHSTLSDRRLIALNNKYLAISWMNFGEIKLVDSSQPTNLLDESSTFSCEKSNILDMEFSPFNDGILSFSNDNNKVYISQIVERDETHIDINSDSYSNNFKKFNFINLIQLLQI